MVATGRSLFAAICEHPFVRSTGHGYSHFRRALDRRQVDAALAAATDLPALSLDDALDLCELLASKGDRRYPQAARRWLARFAAERKPSLADLGIATDALDSLSDESSCHIALKTLRGLI
jgi:hypothetical protein